MCYTIKLACVEVVLLIYRGGKANLTACNTCENCFNLVASALLCKIKALIQPDRKNGGTEMARVFHSLTLLI